MLKVLQPFIAKVQLQTIYISSYSSQDYYYIIIYYNIYIYIITNYISTIVPRIFLTLRSLLQPHYNSVIPLHLVTDNFAKQQLSCAHSLCAFVLLFVFQFFKFHSSLSKYFKNEIAGCKLAIISISFYQKALALSEGSFDLEFAILARFIGISESMNKYTQVINF